jgi:arsenate reductase (thioredoxin)
MSNKPRILFLCTGNSCRSQMAEGWARAFHGDRLEAYSAGIEKHGLNPNAVKVMAEAGVDISGHKSKLTTELPVKEFDYVVTVCDSAHENCPYFPAKTKLIHHNFDDPPRLAESAENEEEALGHYRRVRDEIKEFVRTLQEILNDA